jgi:nucleotide-binding universal stress UspA family protein
MAFKEILVYVDTAKSCPERLGLAVRLALVHGAHLIGLHVRSPVVMPTFIFSELGSQLTELQSQFAAESAAEAKDLFDAAVAGFGLSVEWRDVVGDVIDVVPLHGRYADLTIVGQASLDDDDDTLAERGLVDHLVLEAGRPVLVVPAVGHYPTLGDKVLMAWNSSRESTRAAADALPILALARQVNVLAINPHGGQAGHGDVPGADICLHLARHGVKAVCESIAADDMEVGSMLLSRAADDDADLLVMGAYGRSRLRELVLGGATRHILAHMTLPVFLSH